MADRNALNLAPSAHLSLGMKKQARATRSSGFCVSYFSAALLLLFALGTVASVQPAPAPRLPARGPPLLELPTPRPENFYTVKARKDAEFEALRRQLGELRGEGTGYGRYQEWVNSWRPKLHPHGDFTVAYNAMNRIVREPHPAAVSPRTGTCSGWTELGPLDMPSGGDRQRGVGRVNWIVIDPSNGDNVFTGSAKGGLFYSTDGGDHWQNCGTDFLLPNIGAAHVAVDPLDGNRLFLATGDGDGLNDGYHNNGWNVSHGVYRTLDKGLNWEKIGLDFSTGSTAGFSQIKKLVIAADDSNVIYAATSVGLYRTMNAGDPAALVTWQLLPTGGAGNDDPFYDIDFQPGSTSTIYASGVTLVRSLDGGMTWNPLPWIPFLGPDVVRMAMDVTPAAPNYLYVVVVAMWPDLCNGDTSYVDANGVPHLIRSSRLYRFDASASATQAWSDKGPICGTHGYGSDQRGVHSSRAHSIGVSPINPHLIYLGDVVPVVKCTNGGFPGACNWTGTQDTVHDDIHQVKFAPISPSNPNGLTIYAASDGGVFKTVDGGGTWTAKNKGLGVATVERMSTSATDPSLILAGLFDDGSVLYQNGTWKHLLGGDGTTPIIDHQDPNHMYVSNPSGYIRRSDDMGLSFLYDVSMPCHWWWMTYAVLNSVNTQTVFGACGEVVRSIARGDPPWETISFLTAGVHAAWKIYTAPSNPDYLYTHFVGGTPQLLVRSTNANDPSVAWLSILHPSAQEISDIDVDESDPNKFVLTYSGFVPPDEKVYAYDNGNWRNLTGDLVNNSNSNLQVNSIVRERGSDRIFIGTHLGVYTANSSLSSPAWTRVGATIAGQLPYVAVKDLEINYVNNKLRASTYGRGIWEIALDPCLPTVAGPDAIIRDSVADIGNQPNNESGLVLWASEHIWVRNAPDHRFTYDPISPRYSHEHQHENPEYAALPANTPYVYVKVENRGDQPVSGTVQVHWANASTGQNWQTQWTEMIPADPLTTKVVNLAPGSAWVVHLQWTDIPTPAQSLDGHFCLLARFVADSATPDPIIGEVTGDAVWGNAYNSNNIAVKNVTIVDALLNVAEGQGGQFSVRNISRAVSHTRLDFDLAPGSETFLRSGRIEVDLGRKLSALWKERGSQGRGVKAIGPTKIAIEEPHAFIDALRLVPQEDYPVKVGFTVRPPLPKQREFTLHVMQSDLAREPKSQIAGGVTFVVRPTLPPRPQRR